MSEQTTVLYVVGRIYKPLEGLLRQLIGTMAGKGTPVRAEATQGHVGMLVEAYQEAGRLDRLALYVPVGQGRRLGSSFHGGEDIDRMLLQAAEGGANVVYCGSLTKADEALLVPGVKCQVSSAVVVASSFTDDWRQVVCGTDLAEMAIQAGLPVFWLTTAREAPAMLFAAGQWRPVQGHGLTWHGNVLWRWRGEGVKEQVAGRGEALRGESGLLSESSPAMPHPYREVAA